MAGPTVSFAGPGDHASRPAASSGAVLYACTDHDKIYRSDGSTWADWLTLSAGSVATDAIWDAAGDLAVGSGANTAAKLAAGSEGEVLTIASGVPSWEAASGGGAPTAPYSTNLEVWLDANDITSPPSDGAELTTWDDKSGNGHDFTASAKPTYETNEVNGMPVVRFATNDVMEGGDLSASFPTAATALIAVRFNAFADSNQFSLLEDASEDLHWNFGGTAYMGPWKATRVAITYPVPRFGVHIAMVQSSSAIYRFGWDSIWQSYNTADFQSGTVMHLGKGQNNSFIGDIMEVLLYDAAIPDAGIAESMAYLRDKWGIPT